LHPKWLKEKKLVLENIKKIELAKNGTWIVSKEKSYTYFKTKWISVWWSHETVLKIHVLELGIYEIIMMHLHLMEKGFIFHQIF
jgi:hypothetical protein